MVAVKMGHKTLRLLHLLHIAACAISFGALTTMLILVAAQSLSLLPDCSAVVYFIEFMIYQNGVRLLLLMGLIYGLFTKWGFVKQQWIVAKWIITGAIMILSTVGEFTLMLGVIEFALFFALYILSVYKPHWKSAKILRMNAA